MSESALGQRAVHWFPGHMARTLRRVREKLPLVDAVVQLLDARIPMASLNPELEAAYGMKPRLYVLNKADLADEAITEQWRAYLCREYSAGIAINSKQKGAAARVQRLVNAALAELFRRRNEQGAFGAKIRLMITGIPNVGKSTFINNWAGGSPARAADKPGVTRGEQWITAGRYELLDMPGVLWKKYDNEYTAVNLALVGSIPDTLLDTETIAAGLLEQLAHSYANRLGERFGLSDGLLQGGGWVLLEAAARRRGMLVSGGEVDIGRASVMVLDEFRAGKLGRVSLEVPGCIQPNLKGEASG